MKKILSTCVLAAAVALMALSVSATTSDAKKAKKVAAPATCTMPGYKTTACKGDPSLCATMRCGSDGKWYPAIPCIEPFCPPKG